MCFSAGASFIAAGVTGAIGIAALTRVSQPRELPLAGAPILFAAQQSVEGMLWLDLAPASDGSFSATLTFVFLLFAQVLWPIYAPITVLLVETNRRRRLLMLGCLAAGVSVAAYLLWWILARSHVALILDGHIAYVVRSEHSAVVSVAYLAATTLPLMLSSRRSIVALGMIVLLGCVIAYAFYWEAFVSVWCFFAAAASVTILCHFEWERRERLRVASA